jgi:hypothetical protein
MTEQVLTVTNSLGQISENDADGNVVDLTGSYGRYVDGATGKIDPYRFYAMEYPYTADNPPPAENPEAPFPVQMTLSLGGGLSGFYRYPKIGEQVLVSSPATQDTNASPYLIGYVPSDQNSIFSDPVIPSDSDIIEDEAFNFEGQIMRRMNTAAAFGGTAGIYSEIGFYKKKKAEWPKTAGGTDYPSIDTMMVNSAGNLRKTVSNHYLQQGKRIEILVDAPEMDHRTCKVDDAGTLPLGDYPGDDSYLHEGDIHIRAGNRVVIKAGREIRLQVGRTLLRIGDDGFNVITRNVCGNYINSYDTSLSMTPRDGVALNGKNINLQAGYRLNAGDGMGGAVSAVMGNLSISGRELSMDSFNALEYKFMAAYQGLEYLVNVASGGMALSGEADVRIAEYMKFTVDNLEELLKLARRFDSLWAERNVRAKQIERDEAEYANGVHAALMREEEERRRQEEEDEEDEEDSSEDDSEERRQPEEEDEEDEDEVRVRTEIVEAICNMAAQGNHVGILNYIERCMLRRYQPGYEHIMGNPWIRMRYGMACAALGLDWDGGDFSVVASSLVRRD